MKKAETDRQRIREYRATLKANGLCRDCKGELDTKFSQCEKCRAKARGNNLLRCGNNHIEAESTLRDK